MTEGRCTLGLLSVAALFWRESCYTPRGFHTLCKGWEVHPVIFLLRKHQSTYSVFGITEEKCVGIQRPSKLIFPPLWPECSQNNYIYDLNYDFQKYSVETDLAICRSEDTQMPGLKQAWVKRKILL